MIYLSMLIDESKNGWIYYKNKKIQKRDVYNIVGTHNVKLTFISTSSKNEQCIVLSLFNTRCDIYYKGKKFDIPKSKFPTLDLFERDFGKEIELEITLYEGQISIYNGAVKDLNGSKIVQYSAWGCAMIVEEIFLNKKRYYCNDYENDDDFDDLIFDLEILN